eukprot:13577476-Alexandrium_andersonii.AAC.1
MRLAPSSEWRRSWGTVPTCSPALRRPTSVSAPSGTETYEEKRQRKRPWRPWRTCATRHGPARGAG